MALRVELTDVVRQYTAGGHAVRALDRLTLQIYGGEFTSIVGPSGAGKSTLMHLLGALDSPDSGSIRFDGIDIATMTDDQQSTFRRRKVGFIFQFFNLLPTLTAWENVAIPMLLDGQKPRHRAGGRRSGCWTSSDCARASTTGLPNCPADRCSGSPSHGR